MNTPKSSVAQIIACCAVIGCGVFAFVALIEHGKVQELRQKFSADEAELEFARTIPTWKRMANMQAQLRKEKPEQYKKSQEEFRQMPARMKESRERNFQSKLSNVQARAKMTVSPAEVTALKQIADALTHIHELEPNGDVMGTSDPSEISASMNARKALDELRDQYIEIRLQNLAEGLGQHNPAEQTKFAAAAKQVFTDADLLMGSRTFASKPPAKPVRTPGTETIPEHVR